MIPHFELRLTRRASPRWRAALVLVAAAAAGAGVFRADAAAETKEKDVTKMNASDEQPAAGSKYPQWEKAIRAFEEQDRQQPPPENAILFAGSSSIRVWDLKKYFPQLAAINRGFGGSKIAECAYFADRIVLPYKPSTIVFYAGDNDIASGVSPEQVFEDFKAFAAKVHAALPGTRIIFISIKPSPARWALVDKMREANKLIRAFVQTDKRLTYVDVEPAMLGPDGKPRKELFVSDGLHLNADGYALWTSLVTPYVKTLSPR
jgi:lysophospholipase L1-like esterase